MENAQYVSQRLGRHFGNVLGCQGCFKNSGLFQGGMDGVFEGQWLQKAAWKVEGEEPTVPTVCRELDGLGRSTSQGLASPLVEFGWIEPFIVLQMPSVSSSGGCSVCSE